MHLTSNHFRPIRVHFRANNLIRHTLNNLHNQQGADTREIQDNLRTHPNHVHNINLHLKLVILQRIRARTINNLLNLKDNNRNAVNNPSSQKRQKKCKVAHNLRVHLHQVLLITHNDNLMILKRNHTRAIHHNLHLKDHDRNAVNNLLQPHSVHLRTINNNLGLHLHNVLFVNVNNNNMVLTRIHTSTINNLLRLQRLTRNVQDNLHVLQCHQTRTNRNLLRENRTLSHNLTVQDSALSAHKRFTRLHHIPISNHNRIASLPNRLITFITHNLDLHVRANSTLIRNNLIDVRPLQSFTHVNLSLLHLHVRINSTLLRHHHLQFRVKLHLINLHVRNHGHHINNLPIHIRLNLRVKTHLINFNNNVLHLPTHIISTHLNIPTCLLTLSSDVVHLHNNIVNNFPHIPHNLISSTHIRRQQLITILISPISTINHTNANRSTLTITDISPRITTPTNRRSIHSLRDIRTHTRRRISITQVSLTVQYRRSWPPGWERSPYIEYVNPHVCRAEI